MIASLQGCITAKTTTTLIVEANGIGYEVFVPLSTYYQLPEEKSQCKLHIYTHVREDVLQLFGFSSLQEKSLFLLLTRVSGVGPKLALNILSGIDSANLVDAISEGHLKTLRAIPGVGPKMAGRLVLELKEKVGEIAQVGSSATTTSASGADAVRNDALSALINLGYMRNDVKRALDKILTEQDRELATEELIKEGLKRLAKIR